MCPTKNRRCRPTDSRLRMIYSNDHHFLSRCLFLPDLTTLGDKSIGRGQSRGIRGAQLARNVTMHMLHIFGFFSYEQQLATWANPAYISFYQRAPSLLRSKQLHFKGVFIETGFKRTKLSPVEEMHRKLSNKGTTNEPISKLLHCEFHKNILACKLLS